MSGSCSIVCVWLWGPRITRITLTGGSLHSVDGQDRACSQKQKQKKTKHTRETDTMRAAIYTKCNKG